MRTSGGSQGPLAWHQYSIYGIQVIMTAINAATNLVRSLAAQQVPPQAHSVWVQTLRDDKQPDGFKHSICVSINPKFKGKPDIPDTQDGFEIKRQPWPKGM